MASVILKLWELFYQSDFSSHVYFTIVGAEALAPSLNPPTGWCIQFPCELQMGVLADSD